MNVLVEGTTPFRLVRRIDDLPYPAGDVEPLEDDGLGTPDGAALDAARQRYADLVAQVTDERPEPEAERAVREDEARSEPVAGQAR